MEGSRGFANFESKMHRTHSSASSLLPPDSIRQKIVKLKPKVVEPEDKDKSNVDKLLSGKSAPWKSSSSNKKPSSSKGVPSLKPGVKETKGKRKASENISDKPKGKAPRKATDESLGDEEYSEEVKELIPKVKTIFSYYCSYGEPGNHTKLKSSMFQKLLKDAKIIK